VTGFLRAENYLFSKYIQQQHTRDTILHKMGDSPASMSGMDSEKKKMEEINFRFCPDCSNMLYPRENEEMRTLEYACRTCPSKEPAPSSCVFRNVLNNNVGETAGVTQDVGSDPTLPRSNKTCPKCKNEDAVFFQSQQRSAETGMKLFYVCCNCGFIFQ